MTTDDQNNQDLISALSVSNSQATLSSLIVPPTPYSVVATASSAVVTRCTTTIDNLAQVYPETTLKLKSITKK